MHKFKLVLIAHFLFIGITAFSQVTEKNYKIYSVKLGKEVQVKDIIDDMVNYDVLFFGEEHNDSVAHYLESTIFESFVDKFKENSVLSMEMFERDIQNVMNEYLKDFIREKHFKKDARVWSNYRDYRPMIETAKKNKLDVICANSPSRYTNLAGRKGQKALVDLPEESKKHFAPLPYDTATGAYYNKLMGLTHDTPTTSTDTSKKSAPMPAMAMGGYNLIMGQSLWDATMAYSISSYLKKNKKKKVFQVNGKFHSDEGFAVVAQLKKFSPKLKSIIISSGADDSFPNVDWSKFKSQGDYIIITDPNVPRTYKE